MAEESPFLKEFIEWKNATQQCPCKTTLPGYVMCLYDGTWCSFMRCPRRIYKELPVMLPPPVEPPKPVGVPEVTVQKSDVPVPSS